MAFKSIRWRLQIWYGLIFAVLLSGFGITAFQLEKNRRIRRVDEELQIRINALLPVIRGGFPRRAPELRGPFPEEFDPRPPDAPPGRDGGPPRERGPGGRGIGVRGGPGGPGAELAFQAVTARLFRTDETNSFYYVVWRRNDRETLRSTNAPANLRRPAPASRLTAPIFETRGTYREATAHTPPGDILLVGRSISTELAELRNLGLVLGAVGIASLLVGLAGGWWIATKAIQPIEQISSTALKISSGDLSQRIPAADTENELGRLASVLNSTFARLEAAFHQQERFTSDAAHELRTPITVMLTQTQSALARERPAPEYKESLESCQRAAQRMRKLLDSLLELARLDAGQEQMKRMRVDLADVARRCVDDLGALAREKGLKVDCALPPLPVEADPERLEQVITNLLSNAIYYNKEGGEVRITGLDKAAEIELAITDTGPGIPEADLPRIFERFYRADKSRTSQSGRTGLGLAISKAIVEAHSGSITVHSKPAEGSTFTIHLPKELPGPSTKPAPNPSSPAQSPAH